MERDHDGDERSTPSWKTGVGERTHERKSSTENGRDLIQSPVERLQTIPSNTYRVLDNYYNLK